MNHQPFEEWLLNDIPITSEQKRELDLHLRSCTYCAALFETGNLLNAVKVAEPVEGFTERFQVRLAMQKLVNRRHKFWGAVWFTIGGMFLLMGLAGPSLLAFFSSPATWIAIFVEWGIFLVTTLQALAEAGSVLWHVLPGFMPPFVWMILISALAGIGLLWTVSIWRFTRVSQGV